MHFLKLKSNGKVISDWRSFDLAVRIGNPNNLSTAKDKMEEERGMQLLECIRQAQPNSLKSLLGESTVGIEYKDQYANTPLLLACLMGFCDCLRVLIQYGANYRRINLFGRPPLSQFWSFELIAIFQDKTLWLWPPTRAMRQLARNCLPCGRTRSSTRQAFWRQCALQRCTETWIWCDISCPLILNRRIPKNAKLDPFTECVLCIWPEWRDTTKLYNCWPPPMISTPKLIEGFSVAERFDCLVHSSPCLAVHSMTANHIQ